MNASADEAALRRALRDMWTERDPMPAGLSERVIGRIASADLDREYELLRLVDRSRGLVGARDDSPAEVISLRSEQLSVVLHVSPAGANRCNVVGWVDPPQPVSVQVLQRERQLTVQSDPAGRFDVPVLESGPTRLVLVVGRSGDDGRPPWFATNTLEL